MTNSNGVWTYTSLHDFSGSDSDYLYGSWVILDAAGNIYGTTGEGGEARLAPGAAAWCSKLLPNRKQSRNPSPTDAL